MISIIMAHFMSLYFNYRMVLVVDDRPRKNGSLSRFIGVKKITEQAVKNAALFEPGISL